MNMSFLKEFPGKEELLASYDEARFKDPLKVNNHIHTPYSFSAFNSVSEAVKLAEEEGVKILGINDFYGTDGYEEFINVCMDHAIFPLLNIELIGISDKDQKEGIRINDPKNPGRMYVSGKGLSFPFTLPPDKASKLKKIVEGSNLQVEEMITLLNEWMKKQCIDLKLSKEEIMENYAMNLLRERHVAKRLRIMLSNEVADQSKYELTLSALYNGKASIVDQKNIAGTEEEMRSRLLKSGAPAFVPEDDDAFLPLKEIINLIQAGGGIPTYPMLLDGAGANMTAFEDSKEKLMAVIEGHGISSIELIPLRNDINVLKEYAEYFYENGFVVSFGTEHNTSAMIPITVSAKGGVDLDEKLLNISFNGTAYQAAHQYLNSQKKGDSKTGSRAEMELLGKAVLQYYFDTYLQNK
jgi:hypothetical protein